jgi:hypothetical protein
MATWTPACQLLSRQPEGLRLGRGCRRARRRRRPYVGWAAPHSDHNVPVVSLLFQQIRMRQIRIVSSRSKDLPCTSLLTIPFHTSSSSGWGQTDSNHHDHDTSATSLNRLRNFKELQSFEAQIHGKVGMAERLGLVRVCCSPSPAMWQHSSHAMMIAETATAAHDSASLSGPGRRLCEA